MCVEHERVGDMMGDADIIESTASPAITTWKRKFIDHNNDTFPGPRLLKIRSQKELINITRIPSLYTHLSVLLQLLYYGDRIVKNIRHCC